MPPPPLQTWVGRRLAVRTRLEQICVSALRFLMVVTRQHALAEAARFAGRHTSPCSTLLPSHTKVALSP